MAEFPNTLRTWRRARRFSQLELAMEANVSSRHISFLETGRSRPSPEMIARLGDALELPLDARNQMLTHAGFAARYPEREWNDAEMAPIRTAIEHTLSSHAPYPAIAIDRLWTIVKANDPAKALFALLGVSEGDSILQVMRQPTTPEMIENWPDVARHTASRLRTESAAMGGVREFDEVSAFLQTVEASGTRPATSSKLGPVVPTIFNVGGMRLALFATIAQFGTPEDLLLDDLKIELYFPADEESRQLLETMEG